MDFRVAEGYLVHQNPGHSLYNHHEQQTALEIHLAGKFQLAVPRFQPYFDRVVHKLN